VQIKKGAEPLFFNLQILRDLCYFSKVMEYCYKHGNETYKGKLVSRMFCLHHHKSKAIKELFKNKKDSKKIKGI
jgi:hypothetical protein